MRRRKQARRGVILLIVLGMLAMFAMIGITFVLLSGHARRSAQAQAKVGRADNPPARIADDVIQQILRGSSDAASVIGPHGLLEDLYGNGWTTGAITTVAPIAGGQLFLVQTNVAAPHKHVGCVLTMTSGDANNQSARIVGINNSTTPPSFQILWTDPTVPPATGNTFIINGTPFSGTGFGYENNPATPPTDPLLTATDPINHPYALSPNPRAFTPNLSLVPPYTDPAGPGGANEDYDAADYQNMLLACVVPQTGMTPNVVIPIPSLHRPALVNYLLSTVSTFAAGSSADKQIWLDDVTATASGATLSASEQQTIIEFQRRAILRPLKIDHPNFTGSNENFSPIWDGNTAGNQWDVDNDGDGIMDSIWVDVGLPVRTMRDGRQYKPLAAILCVDMDGRLNLNAHGCLAQAATSFLSPQPITSLIVPDSTGPLQQV